eukprot:6104143-Amphidinium_carterae.1
MACAVRRSLCAAASRALNAYDGTLSASRINARKRAWPCPATRELNRFVINGVNVVVTYMRASGASAARAVEYAGVIATNTPNFGAPSWPCVAGQRLGLRLESAAPLAIVRLRQS